MLGTEACFSTQPACPYCLVKNRYCLTSPLPHTRTATSICTERRLGVALPTLCSPSSVHLGTSRSSAFFFLAALGHVPLRWESTRNPHVEEARRGAQADRHGEMNHHIPGGLRGCQQRSGICYPAGGQQAASLPGDTCKETPSHLVLAEPGQTRGTSRYPRRRHVRSGVPSPGVFLS